MDIPIYLALSLLGLGYYLQPNSQTEPGTAQNNEQTDDPEQDIYTAGQTQKVKNEEEKRMISNIEQSRDHRRSGIIPFYFNTLHLTGSVQNIPNTHYDPELALHDLEVPGLQQQLRHELTLKSLADRPTNDLSSVVQTPNTGTGTFGPLITDGREVFPGGQGPATPQSLEQFDDGTS